MTTTRHIIAAVALLAAAASPAAADDVADFYKGKTVTIVVGHETGTGFDVYARVLQRHLRRHIPGQSRRRGAEHARRRRDRRRQLALQCRAEGRHRLVELRLHGPVRAADGEQRGRFDPTKFNWIGNLEEGVAVCGLSKAAGVATFEDMRTTETIIGGASVNGALMRSALAVKNLFGARMKLVAGYKGTASMKIAIARGEVHGVCGLLMSTITSTWREDYEAGNFRPIIQLSGRTRVGAIANVDDFAKSEDDRQVHGLIFGAQALGKLYAAPPGIPAVRRDALRAALLATMKDPAFVAEAAKTQMDVSPMTGAEVEAFIAGLSVASPAVIERVKQAYMP